MSTDNIVRAIEKHKWTDNLPGVFDDILQGMIDDKTTKYIDRRNQYEKELSDASVGLFTDSLEMKDSRLQKINRLQQKITRDLEDLQDLSEKRYISPQGARNRRHYFEVRRNALAPAGHRWNRKNYWWQRNFNFRRYY